MGMIENLKRNLERLRRNIMAISGRVSDLKLLMALFGNATIKEILQFRSIHKMRPGNKVA